jgi:hypothetical protein
MSGCAGTRLRRTSVSPEDFVIQQKMDKKIKVHLKDGGLYSLNSWKINPSSDTITGIGNHYDYKRNLIKEKKQFTIPAQDITLIETNSITRNLGNLTAFSIVGVPMFA